MGLSAEYLGSTQEDPAAIAAVTAGEVQCVLVTPETLLNNLVARENPLKSTLSAAFNGDSGG